MENPTIDSDRETRGAGTLPPAWSAAIRKIIREEMRGAPPAPTVLTREQAADALQISLRKLDELVAEGKIVAIRIGRTVRITTDALDAYVRQAACGGAI